MANYIPAERIVAQTSFLFSLFPVNITGYVIGESSCMQLLLGRFCENRVPFLGRWAARCMLFGFYERYACAT